MRFFSLIRHWYGDHFAYFLSHYLKYSIFIGYFLVWIIACQSQGRRKFWSVLIVSLTAKLPVTVNSLITICEHVYYAPPGSI